MNEKTLLTKLLIDLQPARRYAWAGLLLYAPITFLNVLQPVIIGYAVQHGMKVNAPLSLIEITMAFFVAVIVLALCELLQGYSLQLAGQTLVAHLRERTFAKAQRLSMGFLDTMPIGRLLTRITNDTESVGEMFSMGAVQIFGDSLFLMGTLIMLLMVDIKLTLYSALILPLLIVGIYYFRLWTKAAYVHVRQSLSVLNGFLQEYLSGIATVQMSNQLRSAHQEFSEQNENYLVANRRAITLDATVYSFVDAMSYLTSALVLWGAFRLDMQHALSLGILVAFLEALSRFFQPIRELANRYAIFQSALVSLERIYELLDWPEEQDSAGAHALSFEREIEFNNVSFAYQPHEMVLNNISFTMKKGERIAVVGSTGAGKSTVIKLLNRFYSVTAGEILIDGKNINTLPLTSTRRLISVVPQEVFLFRGSLRENLSFGNARASDDNLWHALNLVQMKKTIEKRGGLDAVVDTQGQNFSLGERQLLAIARALITDPPILVLDEATASIDRPTEKRLQQAVKKLLAKRTSLVIAHRLSTIMDADRVLVFHRGSLVEQGSHEELLAENGIYAGLIATHFGLTTAV